MKVKLKLIKGPDAGKELKIPTPKCLIGRGEDCHLRPKSDAISRQHCIIYVKAGELMVRDLKSKNGTLVNGERVTEDRVLKAGDTIQVGPLAFEIVIDHTLGGEKKPKVSSVKEAAARTTAGGKETVMLADGDISDWLEEADQQEHDSTPDRPGDASAEARRNRPGFDAETARGQVAGGRSRKEASAAADSKEMLAAGKAKGKKAFGKLPQRPELETKDSRDAAAEMLKKFFQQTVIRQITTKGTGSTCPAALSISFRVA